MNPANFNNVSQKNTIDSSRNMQSRTFSHFHNQLCVKTLQENCFYKR